MSHFNNSSGRISAMILLIGVIIAVSYLFTLSVPKKPVDETPSDAIPGTVGTDTKQALQLNNIPFITATPPITPTPTETPGSSIDFSSSFLDWEDVQVAITNNSITCSQLSPQIISISPYCHWQCPELTTECSNQLQDTVTDELGANPFSFTVDPHSRVGLCLADPTCARLGYSHYQGSTPLPNRVPDQNCQDQIRQCYEASPYRNAVSALNCNDPYNGDCDPSDNICGKNVSGIACIRY